MQAALEGSHLEIYLSKVISDQLLDDLIDVAILGGSGRPQLLNGLWPELYQHLAATTLALAGLGLLLGIGGHRSFGEKVEGLAFHILIVNGPASISSNFVMPS